jgi:multisubunit Na+/H+ antiporter MnhE subunit
MLYTLLVVLAVLWLLGMLSSYTMGGFIHVLLVVAVVLLVVRLFQGRSLAA